MPGARDGRDGIVDGVVSDYLACKAHADAALAAKYIFAQDPDLDVVRDWDPLRYQARMQAVSSLMDATNPDLSTFRARNGKLVMVDCTADYAKTAQASFDYHDAVVARMGKAAAESFLRLYVSPSAEHGCGNTITTAGIGAGGLTTDGAQTSAGTARGMPVNVDWVGILEAWVERGQAPGQSVTATRNDPVAPFAATAAKPLCQYPLYPKSTGGDAAAAASCSCVASGS